MSEACCHHEHTGACGCEHGHGDGETGFPWKLALAAAVFLTGLVIPGLAGLPGWGKGVWMAVAAALPLWAVLREAVEELEERHLGENFLLVIAVAAAFAIGEWTEAVLVLLLFCLGEWLEDVALDYSRDTIAALAAVTPDTAIRLTAAGQETVPATDIVAGDRLLIPPHTRIPVDGTVVEGESAVDASAITGESEPVPVAAGAPVLSGMLNGDGALTVEATRPSADSAAARILRLVEDAAARKGASEKFITRFARVYTPAVTAGAVLVAVVPPLLGGGWLTWIYRALAFLVASCPCALVISIPLSFYAGIARAARQGVLLKGGCYVETLAKVNAVAFDKTGTLTTGNMTLTRVVTAEKVQESEMLALAAALEQHSSHPAGRALCAAFSGEPAAVAAIQEQPGIGVSAQWQGRAVACGGARLLEQQGIDVSALSADMADAAAYLVQDGRVLAAFHMDAELQEGAADVVRSLTRLGVRRLAVLTGDRPAAAQAVAQAVGIREHVYAGLLPEEKQAAVRAMQADGLVTAFIGDGVNDAPVLAAADVGVAMGLGSPAAIETADAVLVSGGLRRLPAAIRLCRRVVATVWSNIAFALAVKAAVLVLAVLGFAPMWLAVFADMGVTLLAVLNALRLLLPGRQAASG